MIGAEGKSSVVIVDILGGIMYNTPILFVSIRIVKMKLDM